MHSTEGKITKTELNNEFNIWYMGTYGRGGPSVNEVHEYMDKRFGKYNNKNGWKGVRIRYEMENEEELVDDSSGDESEEILANDI